MAALTQHVTQRENSRILIVEDDPIQAELLQDLLATIGDETYDIKVAATLAAGLAFCDEIEFDLLILDLNLPDSQGMVTMQKFMEHDQDLSILLNTGMDDENIAMQAMQNGAQDFLVKGQTPPRNVIRSIRYALERKRTLDDLRESQSHLMQQEKLASIGQLAAGVAHEINNPMGFITSNLTSLGSYLSKLKEFINFQTEQIAASNQPELLAEIDRKKKEFKVDFLLGDIGDLIDESLEGAERVKVIVKNLKSFSRVDDNEHCMADINECLESTLNIVWNELKYKCKVGREYGEIDLVKCYPQQLNQVFMNLLVNAGHAIEKDGEIIVRSRQDDCYVYVDISDNGSGIDPAHLTNLFEPFFTTKEVGKGTGLGLSISYDIVTKNHQGEILVDSEIGKGTTFTVKLPRDIIGY